MPHRKIISPFKFLDSYQKKDYHSYFGRDKESLALFNLYKDSTIMILHGPSGSGKTSLIYCGLLNRIREDKKIISIRRDDNLIKSIKKKLFVHFGEGNWPGDSPSKLLDDFYSSHSDLNRILGFIEHIEALMLDVEEKIIERTRNKRKVNQTQPEQFTEAEASGNNEQDDQYIISKYKERLQKFSSERKELLGKLKEKNEQIGAISASLNRYFTNARTNNAGISFAPLIIFDQFEELFVHGTKREIDKFGLFLKLLFNHKIPFNIIISLREEYFGYLDQLQSYIPHIFYKKIRLAHPNKESIKNIIEKSFQKFNINQYVGRTDEKLSDIEKNDRIELILDQIKIKDHGSMSYHLPFLQVYLDRLYKIDYYRTYGGEHSVKEDETLPPLEFKKHEITEFGSIEHVLESYIREINNKIIRNTDNKLNNKIQHKDSIIKFLRHFKTKDDLKKRVPIQIERENYYSIENQKTLTKIQTDIWGDNSPAYNDTISEIINELKEKGILSVNTGYAELSHDIIAKVIRNIRTEDDFRSLIKKDFISSFDIYEDTNDEGDLLSAQQIERMKTCLQYLLEDENTELCNLKKQYYEKSIEKNERDIRNQIRQERKVKRYTIYGVITFGLTILAFLLTGQLLKVNLEKDIMHLLVNANQALNIDRTSSFNYIKKAEQIYEAKFWNCIKMFCSTDDEKSNNEFLEKMKTKILREHDQYPFYQTSINLIDTAYTVESDTIKMTKTRVASGNPDLLYIFALSKNNKFNIWELNYKTPNEKGSTVSIEGNDNIVNFEPFNFNKDLNLLLVKKTNNSLLELGLYDINCKQIENFEKIEIPSNKIHVEHLNGNVFLLGYDNIIKKATFIKNDKAAIELIDTLGDTIHEIKSLEGDNNFAVRYGTNKIYVQRNNTTIRNIFDKESEHDIKNREILSFNSKNKDTLLIGLTQEILVYDLNDNTSYKHMVHDKNIETIDFNNNGDMLIGNRENGINLWTNKNVLKKQFIGHSAPVFNVSFVKVKENPNFVITSSIDQTLKIWNIKPIRSNIKNRIDDLEFKKEVTSRAMIQEKIIDTMQYKSDIPEFVYNWLYYQGNKLSKNSNSKKL